jgi:hypothetical protein
VAGGVVPRDRDSVTQPAMYYEQKGQLEFVHSVTGVRTLKDEFDKVASHNEHHLGQIRLALEGRHTA